MKSKDLKWGQTFNWWMTHPPSEVRNVPKEELGDYQSSYTTWFGYLKEKGWNREGGKWVSPCKTFKFDRIKDAYDCQAYYLEKIKRE